MLRSLSACYFVFFSLSLLYIFFFVPSLSSHTSPEWNSKKVCQGTTNCGFNFWVYISVYLPDHIILFSYIVYMYEWDKKKRNLLSLPLWHLTYLYGSLHGWFSFHNVTRFTCGVSCFIIYTTPLTVNWQFFSCFTYQINHRVYVTKTDCILNQKRMMLNYLMHYQHLRLPHTSRSRWWRMLHWNHHWKNRSSVGTTIRKYRQQQ